MTAKRHKFFLVTLVVMVVLALLLQKQSALAQEWVRASGPTESLQTAGLVHDKVVIMGENEMVVMDTLGTIVHRDTNLPFSDVFNFLQDKDTLWVGTKSGLFFTADEGYTWESTNITVQTQFLATAGEHKVATLTGGNLGLPRGQLMLQMVSDDRFWIIPFSRWDLVKQEQALITPDSLAVSVKDSVYMCGVGDSVWINATERMSGMSWLGGRGSDTYGLRNDSLFISNDTWSWRYVRDIPTHYTDDRHLEGNQLIVQTRHSYYDGNDSLAKMMFVSLTDTTLQPFFTYVDNTGYGNLNSGYTRCYTPTNLLVCGARSITLADRETGASRFVGFPAMSMRAYRFLRKDSTLILHGRRVWRSTNNGSTWMQHGPSALPSHSPFRTVSTLVDSTILYIYQGNANQYSNTQLYISTDLGKRWLQFDDRVSVIAVDGDGKNLFVISTRGTYIARDGRMFNIWNVPLPGTIHEYDPAFAASGDRIALKTTFEKAFMSDDHGRTWRFFQPSIWAKVRYWRDWLIMTGDASAGATNNQGLTWETEPAKTLGVYFDVYGDDTPIRSHHIIGGSDSVRIQLYSETTMTYEDATRIRRSPNGGFLSFSPDGSVLSWSDEFNSATMGHRLYITNIADKLPVTSVQQSGSVKALVDSPSKVLKLSTRGTATLPWPLSDLSSITCTTVNGQAVDIYVQREGDKIQMDFTPLPPGLYFLTSTNGKQSFEAVVLREAK